MIEELGENPDPKGGMPRGEECETGGRARREECEQGWGNASWEGKEARSVKRGGWAEMGGYECNLGGQRGEEYEMGWGRNVIGVR